MERKKIDTAKLIRHLDRKWGKVKCPMCNHEQWSISDTVYELREFNQGNMIIGNVPIVPIIPITCMNCGNTIMINAIVSDIIKQPTKSEKNDKEGGNE